MKPITKAILPVAGLGTRFLPATKAQPKEMLPVFDKPAIQYIVEEAAEAGIHDMVLITGKSKRALEDHFDQNVELILNLEQKGKHKEVEMCEQIVDLANFVFIRQPHPGGDGHAIACAGPTISDDESVVVLFGDDLVDNEGKNAVQQLIEVYEEYDAPVVLLERIDKKESKKYGMVGFSPTTEDVSIGEITHFVEKPDPKDAPSDLGVVGKFIITPSILRKLTSCSACEDGEVRLANAFIDYIQSGGKLYGKVLEGKRFDTGDKMGFLEATLHYAQKENPEGVDEVIKSIQTDTPSNIK